MDLKLLIQKQLNRTTTENGDLALKTTGSACLDYFSIIGGMRNNLKDATTLMIRAYYEDYRTFLKLLLYTRDIKDGLGERRLFRYLYHMLSIINTKHAKVLMPLVQSYGRFDDLLVLMDSKLEDDVIDFFKKQIDKDKKAKKYGDSTSLLGKWLPSINASNQETRYYAKKLIKGLNMNKADYRKMCVYLREDLIIENHLREKRQIEDYNKISEQAMFKNFNALSANDKEGLNKALAVIESRNTNNLYPHQIANRIIKNHDLLEDEKKLLETFWYNLPRHEIGEGTLVVRDGSGSMYEQDGIAISVATALSILFSESIKGVFHNSFITFSKNPELVTLKSDSIYGRIMETLSYGEVANTDIGKVFQLIIDAAKTHQITKEQMIKRLIIISDMEFDSCVLGMSSYDYFKAQFEDLGYALPTLVFWNVNARHIHYPTDIDQKVLMVSGMNQKMIELIIKDELVSPYDLMMETLERYEVIDALL